MRAGRKTGGRKKIGENKQGPEMARRAAEIPGITAKALLLTVMRTAWAEYWRKTNEAEEIERRAMVLDQEAAVEIRGYASSLRVEAALDMDFAIAVATAVLPYEHPRLYKLSLDVDQSVNVICQ